MLLSERSSSAAPAPHKKYYDEVPVRSDGLLPTRINRKAPFFPPEERKSKIASMLSELKSLVSSPLVTAKQVEF